VPSYISDLLNDLLEEGFVCEKEIWIKTRKIRDRHIESLSIVFIVNSFGFFNG
jgi:hypothetical protein